MHRFGKVINSLSSKFQRNVRQISNFTSSNRSKFCGGVVTILSVSAGYYYIIEAQTLAMEKLPFKLAHPDVSIVHSVGIYY